MKRPVSSQRLGLVLVLCCATLSPLPLPAQDSPREVRVRAKQALAAGAYEEAILLLQQLIDWFKDSKKRATVVELENYYFTLGLCFYLTGQFEQSEETFKTYLKKYRDGPHAAECAVYIADGYRFTEKLPRAVKEYRDVLDQYALTPDWQTDVYCSLVRCALAGDDWATAIPLLKEIYAVAPDEWRATWAATLLTIAYLKELRVENVYPLVPYLMRPASFASRSVAFNLAALEAADGLFAEEKYRDALWIYRLIFPRELIRKRGEGVLEELQDEVEYLREQGGKYRELLRAQENIAELEQELKALETLEDYDDQLGFRMARAYMEIARYREARALFLDLHDRLEEDEAEQCLFLAFHCSTQVRPWDRAFEIGAEYMEAHPGGEYYDEVSLTLGQMYATLKDWPRVISLLTAALEVSPEHESVAECLFLIGYASFMEEDFADAIRWLEKLNAEYPGNDRYEEAVYWLGMAQLFSKQYSRALATFDLFLGEFPRSSYAEDASFRRAVCDYGLSRFEAAEERLNAFVRAYPNSILVGEAHLMLADSAGTYGAAEKSVEHFRLAIEHELNIELYNYCYFRCGEILHDLNDFDGVVALFRGYLEANREGSNVPLAAYWIGKAMWQLGQQQEAMEFLLKCVSGYGQARDALGVDLILNEWIARGRSLPAVVSREAWRYLGTLLKRARESGDEVLALRLERVFLYNPDLSDRARELVLGHLLRAESLEHAAAGVLEFIMDEAPKQGQPELARLAAETVVRDFTETDYVVSARLLLAENAMAEEDYATAERHLGVIREVFATRPEAAAALLLLGELYVRQRQFTKADDCYKDVLGVREWRGPAWPAALYGRGECARLQREYAQATAYYERIYLLYSHYRDWAAKAYVARAHCLVRMREAGKARETLAEMLAITELAGQTAAVTEARQLLAQLGGDGR